MFVANQIARLGARLLDLGLAPELREARIDHWIAEQKLQRLAGRELYDFVVTSAVYIDFEWDVAKAESNLQKHGISFDAASLVFYDPQAVVEQDRLVEGELRWRAIGWGGALSLLVVIHTSHMTAEVERIRIISARPAIRKERRQYGQANS